MDCAETNTLYSPPGAEVRQTSANAVKLITLGRREMPIMQSHHGGIEIHGINVPEFETRTHCRAGFVIPWTAEDAELSVVFLFEVVLVQVITGRLFFRCVVNLSG